MTAVSVVIPLYNAKDLIARTIESVMHQTFKNYEIIVIDDGSIDSSGDVVKRFGDRIRYYYFENGGVARARNRGIKLAQGDYVAFLDHDDLWAPAKLERQVQVLDTHPEVGLVITNLAEVDHTGRLISTTQGYHPDEPYNRLFVKGYSALPSAVMIRRNILEHVGGFDEGFDAAGLDDLELWPRIAQVCEIYCVPELLTYHHKHSPADPAVGLRHRQLLIEKLFKRFGSDPEKRRYLLSEQVAYFADFGKFCVLKGDIKLGRVMCRKAIAVSFTSLTNGKMCFRSALRLLWSYWKGAKMLIKGGAQGDG